MKFIGRVAIGFCVCTPFTCALAGGVEDGLTILFLSIVCTAGIGLIVFWLPLWWVVGWVALAIVGLMTELAAEPIIPSAPVVGRKDLALLTYIREAMAAGMNQDVLTSRLQANGWNPAEIQSAREKVISSTSPAAGPSPA